MQTPTGRQAARSRAARESIVEAALGVFALKGYAATSMDDICLAAGCSKGGLYHHFGTKSAVLSGVVDKLADAGALMPPFAADGDSHGIGPDAMARVLLEVWACAARDEPLRAQLRAGAGTAATAEDTAGADRAAVLDSILRIGALVEALTRSGARDPGEAAQRLGIGRAA